MEEICIILSQVIRSSVRGLIRLSYGRLLRIYWELWRICMEREFYIGILKVPIFLFMGINISQVILMCRKLMVENWLIRKQVHHIMLVLKYGEMNLMIIKVIFGLLVVFCTNQLVLNHLFKEETWTNYLKIFKKVHIHLFLKIIRYNQLNLSINVCRKIQKIVQKHHSFSNIQQSQGSKIEKIFHQMRIRTTNSYYEQ